VRPDVIVTFRPDGAFGRVASGGLPALAGLAAGAPRGSMGIAVVLPSAQRSERRTSARNRSLWRDQ